MTRSASEWFLEKEVLHVIWSRCTVISHSSFPLTLFISWGCYLNAKSYIQPSNYGRPVAVAQGGSASGGRPAHGGQGLGRQALRGQRCVALALKLCGGVWRVLRWAVEVLTRPSNL